MTEKNRFTEVMRDLQGYFKEGERRLIYNACKSLRDKVLIRMLWKSGRRIGEILMLKIGEINFEENHILWHIEKKKKPTLKIKPMDTFTMKLLKYFIDEEGLSSADFLFQGHPKEKHLTRQRAFQIVRKVCLAAGIDYVGNKKPHPHHFRHSLAIDIAKKSKSPADIRKLQQFLEHSSLDITENYLQFGDEELRELIEED